MEEQDYYALVNYRGKVKYYHVLKHDNEDIRINYIDYNPNRQYSGVWITGGKNKIIEKFKQGTGEYEYFNALKTEFQRLVDVLAIELFNNSKDRTLPDVFYYSGIGTDNIKKAYKKAYLSVKKPGYINF